MRFWLPLQQRPPRGYCIPSIAALGSCCRSIPHRQLWWRWDSLRSGRRSMRIPRRIRISRSATSVAWRGCRAKTVSADDAGQALLACTFLNQKFPHTTPDGAILLRAFFGGPLAPELLKHDDATLIRLARTQLERYLGKLPEPSVALVRRWPNSLPLYAVGHQDRMAELDSRIAQLPHLRLIGNAYRGVGLPDLIRSGRAAAREIMAT